MKKGDPEDPVPILRAAQEIARNWETQIDIEGDSSQGPDMPEGSPVWEMSEAQLKRHYGSWTEASLGVFRVAVLSLKIRVWVASGAEWKRPTIQTIHEHLPPQSGGLYVDQEEVRRVFGNQWPSTLGSLVGELPWPNAAGHASKRAIGRPRSMGYSPKDVPIFRRILEAQRESGDVESKFALVKKFADEADGTSFASKVDRLRKGLPRWLTQNGHEWVRSI